MALLCTGENFYSCGTIQSRGSIICLPLQNLYTYIYMYWHIYMYIYDNHIYESIWVESLKLLLYTATGENFYFCGTNRSRGPMIFLPFGKLQTSKKIMIWYKSLEFYHILSWVCCGYRDMHVFTRNIALHYLWPWYHSPICASSLNKHLPRNIAMLFRFYLVFLGDFSPSFY